MAEDHEFLFVDEPYIEPDDSQNHLGNEEDIPLIPDDDAELQEPIHRSNSRHLRDKIAPGELQGKVLNVLAAMRAEGINLPIFLDALCWGDESCISDGTIRYARTTLMTSEELPGILDRCYHPPRAHGEPPQAARKPLLDFAVRTVSDAIDREMMVSAFLFFSPPQDLSEEHLTSLDFDELKDQLQQLLPILWRLLRRAAYTPQQDAKNKHKNPDMVVLHMISQAQYTRSNRRGRVAKLWSIYLKACGLSARAFDALHVLGILMSHKWTADAIGTLSDRAMKMVQKFIHIFPWIISHDNLNVALRVFSQRLNNQSHFVSGCVYTVWILPMRAALPPNMNRILQTFRAERCLEVFDFAEILYGDEITDDRMQAFDEHYVLRLLLDSPDFADYRNRADPMFAAPPPVNQLEGGPENAVRGCILETSTYEEQSYEGTLNVMADAFRQLLLDSKDEQMKTAIERIIAWLGDQLTVERLRGLWKFRHEDHNAFDRLDFMIPIFGWFHLVMAFANSIHKQYLGTSAAELRELAAKLIRKYASRAAVNDLDNMDSNVRDNVFRQWTMFNTDVLPYLQLRQAIKSGDFGRMEDLIPTLLFRFAGGGNSKYAVEMLELIQGLRREWPEVLRRYIKEFCWLMTRTGTFDNWLAYDLGQEENIADIKVNYRAMGPGATMEHMGKVSPAIPAMRKVQRHMENQFKTTARGTRHGVPDKEKDIEKLTAHYMASKIHTNIPGRPLKTTRAQDFVTDGAIALEQSKTIDAWFKRRTHARATGEDWSGEANEIEGILLASLEQIRARSETSG
ncbi:hypothetical protein C8R43DRAFT_1121280 [Mycena crocata]|nr:hypothetical protein C8R43DRAFT_1121280 [Mycena crocata]